MLKILPCVKFTVMAEARRTELDNSFSADSSNNASTPLPTLGGTTVVLGAGSPIFFQMRGTWRTQRSSEGIKFPSKAR